MKTPEERQEEINRELAEHDVIDPKTGKKVTLAKIDPTYQVQVKDPLTGDTKLVNFDRAGHTEQKLIIALANPDLKRDQKDHALSMYLFERGAENSSMLIDLFRYKGEHTKESRVFQSRMRFDFEAFVSMFTSYLRNQSRLLGLTLGVNIKEEKEKFQKWLELPKNKNRFSEGIPLTYVDYFKTTSNSKNKLVIERAALIEMGIYSLDEAERLAKNVENIANARMATKGYGIYVDKRGRPFNVNEPGLDEIIKQDRELQEEAEKDVS